ncbi:hypothetical protein PG999_011881 [Apiospora kogelbergensis]|uniref:Uncharacterized protein n=1 Tax=Apiospora kogelbergensis TaxID=1337665 RepID=A0AAW0QFK1_9PEZI
MANLWPPKIKANSLEISFLNNIRHYAAATHHEGCKLGALHRFAPNNLKLMHSFQRSMRRFEEMTRERWPEQHNFVCNYESGDFLRWLIRSVDTAKGNATTPSADDYHEEERPPTSSSTHHMGNLPYDLRDHGQSPVPPTPSSELRLQRAMDRAIERAEDAAIQLQTLRLQPVKRRTNLRARCRGGRRLRAHNPKTMPPVRKRRSTLRASRQVDGITRR